MLLLIFSKMSDVELNDFLELFYFDIMSELEFFLNKYYTYLYNFNINTF